ncbi:beta-ketoacyl synthase N-terminal-like domain-containing protein [Pyxidicoccus sp. 3LG]
MGMTTSLGLRAAATEAAVRAGIARLRESTVYNRQGEPMILSHVPDEALPPLISTLEQNPKLSARQRRMLQLATPALQEAISPLSQREGIPLVLAGPEPYPGQPPAFSQDYLGHLREQSEVPFSREASSVTLQGRAGGLVVLDTAMKLLHARGFPYILVGGVDSYLDMRTLGMLDRDGRVHAAEVLDGFVPGEGAAFLLLSSSRNLPTSRGLAFLSAPGLGQEQGHRYSESPYLGNGLADAVRTAVQGIPERSIHTAFTSLNGESFGAKEWGVASIRNSKVFHEKCRVEHPADCFGDLGAAIGPVLIGLATLGLRRGYVPGPRLIWCSSDGTTRAATLVSSDPL